MDLHSILIAFMFSFQPNTFWYVRIFLRMNGGFQNCLKPVFFLMWFQECLPASRDIYCQSGIKTILFLAECIADYRKMQLLCIPYVRVCTFPVEFEMEINQSRFEKNKKTDISH